MAELGESARKEIEILRALSEFDKPVGSTLLRQELGKRGFFISERTIRYHLQLLEMKSLVLGHERSGRTITPQGLEELSRVLASQRLGFVITRFLSMAYSATYNPDEDSGTVVANVSIMEKAFHDKMLETVKILREMNLLPAPYIKVLDEKEEYGDIAVPEGKIALFTVCDLTIDSILIHAGIPLFFKCGGLVQMVNHKPVRMVEIITYEGTTIPPLELFVRSNKTSITRILKTGSGMLPVAAREILIDARERTAKILTNLKNKGWGGILVLGEPNEPLLGMPISMDRFGLCMVGGMIPGAAMIEEGAQVETLAPDRIVPIKEMTRI